MRMLGRALWGVIGVFLFSSLPISSVLASNGASTQLTMTLVMRQSTCDVGLLTPSTINFPPMPLNALMTPGHVVYAGTQTVTLGLTNCAGSAMAGMTPAIQVLGTNPWPDDENIFRDEISLAGGHVGFGLRYQPPSGAPGDYLKSGDYVDLGGVGDEVSNQTMNFQVDMLRGSGGGSPTVGSLLANIRFMFTYH